MGVVCLVIVTIVVDAVMVAYNGGNGKRKKGGQIDNKQQSTNDTMTNAGLTLFRLLSPCPSKRSFKVKC